MLKVYKNSGFLLKNINSVSAGVFQANRRNFASNETEKCVLIIRNFFFLVINNIYILGNTTL